MVVNHRTDLSVWGVLATVRFGTGLEDENTYDHQKSCLDLELFMDLLILDRIAPQILVKAVPLGCFDDARGEDLHRVTVRSDAETSQMSGGYKQDLSHAVFGLEHERKVRDSDWGWKYLVEEIVDRLLDLLRGHGFGVGGSLQEIRPKGLHLPGQGILWGLYESCGEGEATALTMSWWKPFS